jgi:hypothetical protein
MLDWSLIAGNKGDLNLITVEYDGACCDICIEKTQELCR